MFAELVEFGKRVRKGHDALNKESRILNPIHQETW